ncbi:hypothetical protein F7725_015355 [Dissostichus mawsoni]|uniref:Uncharacterized protein n=1 Tax=Dissostichus mawsoni TaxID=36200 RepID=A0A7J5YKN3_DISMA|nr:hypothetical protein F7725_015355 [Dissostichus mawsoni]
MAAGTGTEAWTMAVWAGSGAGTMAVWVGSGVGTMAVWVGSGVGTMAVGTGTEAWIMAVWAGSGAGTMAVWAGSGAGTMAVWAGSGAGTMAVWVGSGVGTMAVGTGTEAWIMAVWAGSGAGNMAVLVGSGAGNMAAGSDPLEDIPYFNCSALKMSYVPPDLHRIPGMAQHIDHYLKPVSFPSSPSVELTLLFSVSLSLSALRLAVRPAFSDEVFFSSLLFLLMPRPLGSSLGLPKTLVSTGPPPALPPPSLMPPRCLPPLQDSDTSFPRRCFPRRLYYSPRSILTSHRSSITRSFILIADVFKGSFLHSFRPFLVLLPVFLLVFVFLLVCLFLLFLLSLRPKPALPGIVSRLATLEALKLRALSEDVTGLDTQPADRNLAIVQNSKVRMVTSYSRSPLTLHPSTTPHFFCIPFSKSIIVTALPSSTTTSTAVVRVIAGGGLFRLVSVVGFERPGDPGDVGQIGGGAGEGTSDTAGGTSCRR